jgi:hypothetical protein
LIFFNAPSTLQDIPDNVISEKPRNVSSKNVDSLYLGVGIGQEHRLGRWWRLKGVKNQIMIINLGIRQ